MNFFLRYTSVCVQPITLEALDDCDAHSDLSVFHICTFLETSVQTTPPSPTVYNESLINIAVALVLRVLLPSTVTF